MKASGEDFRGVIAGAIYREIGARDFYRLISDTIKNPEGKERFGRLSQDEEGHRVKLEGWYKKLFKRAFVAEAKEIKNAEIRGFTVDEKTGAMAALDIAIKAEAKAEEFYASQALAVDEPKLKDLLEHLAQEEHGHYELLSAERNALTGQFYWFDMDSTPFLED